MAKRKSLTKQVQDELRARLRIGESKHEAKKAGTMENYIFSWSTYRAYIKHLNYFTAYCKTTHECKTLKECEPFAAEWLQTRSELSPYTQKLEAAALRKIYGNDLKLNPTPPRRRADIKRSRGIAARDKRFNKENNAEFIAFCRSTGLRRSEITNLRGDQLTEIDGNFYLEIKGKGGRVRYAPIIGNISNVVGRCILAAETGQKVWPYVPDAADIHSYRADYCHAIYDQYARDLDDIPPTQRYHCKGDRAGAIFDRRAMKEASEALGHSRINVIAAHYLR